MSKGIAVDTLEKKLQSLKEKPDKGFNASAIAQLELAISILLEAQKKRAEKIEIGEAALAKAGVQVKDGKIRKSDVAKASTVLAEGDEEFDLSDETSSEDHEFGPFKLAYDGKEGNWEYYLLEKDGKDGAISINHKTKKIGKVPSGPAIPEFTDEEWLELFSYLDKEFGGDYNF